MALSRRTPEEQISHSDLLEMVLYDPETGEFKLLKRTRRFKQGARLGYIHKVSGYRLIRLLGVEYRAGRLAWFYMTGTWPPELVDHEDRDRSNDRWKNLRLADHSQNNMNCSGWSSTGEKGVTLVKRKGRKPAWVARIKREGKLMYLGQYRSLAAASAAYQAAARHGR